MLGFVVASIVATIFSNAVPADVSKAAIGVANDLRTWFLTFAFVSIGLEFNIGAIREAGWRPIAVFAIATLVNLVVGLSLVLLLWSNFTI